ncbi:hypothetical protein AB4Z54_57745, partial [Streptomyces sp. MCAF7]
PGRPAPIGLAPARGRRRPTSQGFSPPHAGHYAAGGAPCRPPCGGHRAGKIPHRRDGLPDTAA